MLWSCFRHMVIFNRLPLQMIPSICLKYSVYSLFFMRYGNKTTLTRNKMLCIKWVTGHRESSCVLLSYRLLWERCMCCNICLKHCILFLTVSSPVLIFRCFRWMKSGCQTKEEVTSHLSSGSSGELCSKDLDPQTFIILIFFWRTKQRRNIRLLI